MQHAMHHDSGPSAGLNALQRTVVAHGEGPMLVVAGAGSGKTRVIMHRIAQLLARGVVPARILGVTFTNKAARQMRTRLVALVGAGARGVPLLTFHALALRILKEDHAAAGLAANFSIYDTADQLSVIRELMRQVRVCDRRLDTARVLELVLRAKRQRRDDVEITWGDDYEMAAFDLYPRYMQAMQDFGAIDFDDLVLRCNDLLATAASQQRWSARFDHILVDEYQDTSPDQLQLLRALATPRHNICAVGDDDQSIYAWRGAAADNILHFARHFGGRRPVKEVMLEQNYRSTGHILAAANAIMAHKAGPRRKTLWSAHDTGAPVDVVSAQDGDDEASFVTEQIMQRHHAGVSFGNMAVLYRSNAQSRPFEESLASFGVPFKVVGGQAFFDRKEVRDAMAFLAVCLNPRDETALRRIINVPPRGLGPKALEHLSAVAQASPQPLSHGNACGLKSNPGPGSGVDLEPEGHSAGRPRGLYDALRVAAQVSSLSAAARSAAVALHAQLERFGQAMRALRPGELAEHVSAMLNELGLRESILAADDPPTLRARRLENLQAVAQSVARFEARLPPDQPPLAAFLRASSISRHRQDDESSAASEVTLMTLHGAKGLEFDDVFMVGLEEGLLPHRRFLEDGGDLNEERRLCYVGITRARRRLWLCHVHARMHHGRLQPVTPSRFVQELYDAPCVRRYDRAPPSTPEESEALAKDFFARMRAQLGP